jgi:ssDNA-binding Zn-finger/Zn-ribbon topoisomerase 1
MSAKQLKQNYLARRQPMQTEKPPYCPECDAKMVEIIPNRNQYWNRFWGCPWYPECKGTRSFDDDKEENLDVDYDEWLDYA